MAISINSDCQNIATGTREWADSKVNLIFGCVHNCRYCYAKKMAIRFGRKTAVNWKDMELNPQAIIKNYKKREGRVMFPTTHDLVDNPTFLEPCLIVLGKLLSSGNHVLVTTKPHICVIQEICTRYDKYRELIQFRFTIGSLNNNLLTFWEPGAPLFEERLMALQWAFQHRFKTSVSIEPYLDYDPRPLVEIIREFVTESIWIGIMHYIDRKGLTQEEISHYDTVRKNYTYDHVLKICKDMKSDQLIRWKDSIKKILIARNAF